MSVSEGHGEAARRGGRTLLVVQHEVNGPPGYLEAVAKEAGLDLDVRVAEVGDAVPEEPGDAAGVAVLGASIGVRDAPEHPYLYELMDLIRASARSGTPVLGVCLGGQLSAQALGGRAGPGRSGLEVGWIEVRTTQAGRMDPITAVLGEGTPLFQWHKDEFVLPPGAIRLLVGDRYPNQAFRLGSVWGFQPHPEVDPELVWLWSREGARELERAGVDPEDLLRGAERHARRARSVLEAWVRLVAAGSGRIEATS